MRKILLLIFLVCTSFVSLASSVNIPEHVPSADPEARNLDLSHRVMKEGKAYAKGDSEPYTGIFTVFIGDIVEYTITYDKGIQNGEEIYYSTDGKLPLLIENYKNGKLDGNSYEYYDEGMLKTYKKYQSGRVVAIKSLDKDGNTIHESSFQSGTGTWRLYWNNGKVLEQGNYKNWKKDGTWVRYLETGHQSEKTVYQDGKVVSHSYE